MRVKLLLFTCFYLSSLILPGQNRLPAFEMNQALGRGMNMGNSFEAPSEAEWGNPWKPEYFKIIAELGFNHVRLPVRWEPTDRSLSTSPYTINPVFLERIKQVVDSAFKYNLHIIVNMHHHEALFENPAGQKERFLSLWNQIATYFKDYPNQLLFEVMNEPHSNITPELWNVFFAGALMEIRKTNPTRVVLMGVAEYGGLGGIAQLQLPIDDYLILSPHYYNPFNFTHQGADGIAGADSWIGTKWNDTEAERETVASEFSYAMQFSETNHIPVHVGEFGSYNKADSESRNRWTTFLARWFEQQNMSWAYWEFSAGFGIYNPTTKVINTPLADALLHNEMPEPTPVISIPVYTSDFSSGNDGWALTVQSGASGALTVSGGKLNVSLTNGGTESWHVQLVKNNISLQKDRQYQISFNAMATADRSATFYAGKASDPWNAYSGYNGISIAALEKAFTFSFIMNSQTDMASRLVFDLGKNLSGVSISEVRVEELKLVITEVEEDISSAKIIGYPSPVKSILYIKGLERYQQAELYDLKGQSQSKLDINQNTEWINLEKIPQRLYVLSLTGPGLNNRLKIIKD